MRFLQLLFSAAIALGAAGTAAAQSGLEKTGSFTYPHADRVSVSALYSGGVFYLAETNTALPYEQWQTRLVRVDPQARKAEPLLDAPAPLQSEPVFVTPTRLILVGERNYNREGRKYHLYARSPFEEMTDIRLMDEVFDVMDSGHDLLVLQYDVPPYESKGPTRAQGLAVLRFDANDLSYRGMTKLPEAGLRSGIFHDGAIVAVKPKAQCADGMRCMSIVALTLDGTVKSSVDIDAPRPQSSACGELGVVSHARGLVLVQSGCKYFALNNDASRVLYALDVSNNRNDPPAIFDDFILIRDSFSRKPDSTLSDVRVFDRRDGKLLTTVSLPFGALYSSGDRLLLMTGTNKEMVVETYRLDAAQLRGTSAN